MKFSKFIKHIHILTLLCVINIALIVGAVYHSKNSTTPKISIKALNGYHKEFRSGPIYNNGFITVSSTQYPYVQIAPSDPRYFYILFKENRDLKSNKYDRLFYANKRISELLKWGDQIPILLVTKPQNITILKAAKKVNSQVIKDNNSWEAVLIRYFLLLDEEIDQLELKIDQNREESLKEIILLSARLKSHQSDLNLVVENQGKTVLEKKYITNLTKDIFNRLNSRLKPYIPSFNPTFIYFPLSEVMSEREYGTYEASVSDIGNLKEAYTATQLAIGNGEYLPAHYDAFENELVYKNIQISALKKPVALFQDPFLRISSKNLVSRINWKQYKKNPSYYMDFIDSSEIGKYYFRFRSRVKVPHNIKLQHIYTGGTRKGKTIITDLLIDQPVNIRAGKAPEFEQIVQLKNVGETNHRIRIKVDAEIPLTREDLKSIMIEIDPFYSPIITLKKVNTYLDKNKKITLDRLSWTRFNLRLQNVTQTEENYILDLLSNDWMIKKTNKSYQDGIYIHNILLENKFYSQIVQVLIIFNILIGLAFIFKNLNHNTFLRKNLINLRFTSLITHYFSKHTFLIQRTILILTVLLLFFDIFVTRSYTDLVICGGLLLLICTYKSYRIDFTFSFLLGLLFLTTSPILIFFGMQTSGEKIAVWAFTLLILASLQLLIRLRNGQSVQSHYDELVFRSLRVIWTIFVYSIALIERFLRTIYSKLFILKPKTPRELIRNIIVAILFIFMTFIIYRIVNVTKFYIDIEIQKQNLKNLRESLNPRITTVEPKLAYYSNKIVIYGDNFGWTQNKNVRLMSQVGLVTTDLWSNDKIIFTIPLHWKIGHTYFWIEKVVSWENTNIKAKSKIFTILIIPRSNTFKKQDDEYFNNLKTLKDETLLINGYNPREYKK